MKILRLVQSNPMMLDLSCAGLKKILKKNLSRVIGVGSVSAFTSLSTLKNVMGALNYFVITA